MRYFRANPRKCIHNRPLPLTSHPYIIGQKIGQKMGQKVFTTREKLLYLIAENPNITRKELTKILNVPSSTVQYHIEKLKSEHRIERIGGAKGGHWIIID